MNDLSVYDSKSLGDKHCWYCGEWVFDKSRTKDHFWPKVLGGRLKVVCCRNCNGMKGPLTPVAFILYIEQVKALSPSKQNLFPKFDRMITATQTLWDRTKWSIKE